MMRMKGMFEVEHRKGQFYRGPLGVVLQPVVRAVDGHGLAHRYRLLWKAHRAVWRLTRSNRLAYNGFDMMLDPLDCMALAKGWYEPQETGWYDANVKPGDYVVEAGANIGVFTLQLCRLVGPTGRVRAYEPDPDLFALLKRNVEANGLGNAILREAAVADKSGTMTLFRTAKNTGDTRLFSHEVDSGSVEVAVVTLDDELIEDNRRIDLFKIDIQGAEPLATRGMRNVIETRPPRRIMMEFWPHGMVGMGQDPRAHINFLMDSGYRIITLDDGRPFDLDAALRDLTPESEAWVNLLLIHESEGSLDE